MYPQPQLHSYPTYIHPPTVGMIYLITKISQNCWLHISIILKMYIPQPYPRTLQQSFQVMSIQHQHIYSTYIYSQNCLQHIFNTKIYLKYIYSPTMRPKGTQKLTNLHSSPQLLAWYIQYQHIYSTDIYSPNFWQHMFNTNIYFNKSIFPNTAPEGRTETPTIHPAPKCWPDIFNAHIWVIFPRTGKMRKICLNFFCFWSFTV